MSTPDNSDKGVQEDAAPVQQATDESHDGESHFVAASTTEEEEQQQEQDDVKPLSTPSISMSAGADPWADPSPAAVMASAVPPSTRSADNPWASNTPDLVSDAGAFQPEPALPKTTEGHPAVESSDRPLHQNERWGEYHLPKLGNAVARYWNFRPGFLQLNNGERVEL